MPSKAVLPRAGQYGNCEENPDTLGVALEVTQGTLGARLGKVSDLGHSALPSVFCTIDKRVLTGSWKLLQTVISESEVKACWNFGGVLLAQVVGKNGDFIWNLKTLAFFCRHAFIFNLGRKLVGLGSTAVYGCYWW